MTDYTDLIARLTHRPPTLKDIREAADALEAQARRISELESMIAVHRLAVDVDALKARIAELKAALRPFAEHIAEAEWEQYNYNTRVAVRLADLRAARAAYLGEKE